MIEIKVSSVGREIPCKFYVHLLQLFPQCRYSKYEQEYSFSLIDSGVGDPNKITSYQKKFPVMPDVVLEVCLAQFWSSLEQSSVSVEIIFHGLSVSVSSDNQSYNGSSLNLGSNLMNIINGNGFARADVAATLQYEEIDPVVSFGRSF